MHTDKIVELYQNGFSLREIQQKTGIHHLRVRKYLIKLNISRRTQKEGVILSKQNSFFINKKLKDVIEGELLGDGHLKKGLYQSCFTYGSSQEEYVKWLSNIFITNDLPLSGGKMYKNTGFDVRYGKYYTKYLFSTLHCVELKKIRELWYQNNVKRVPNNFILNKTSLLHWWIGDGSLNKKSNYAWFATDNFSKTDVEFLSKQLIKLGIKNSIRLCKNKYTSVYRIYVPRIGVLDLLHIIGESPVKCYKYKWNCRG